MDLAIPPNRIHWRIVLPLLSALTCATLTARGQTTEPPDGTAARALSQCVETMEQQATALGHARSKVEEKLKTCRAGGDEDALNQEREARKKAEAVSLREADARSKAEAQVRALEENLNRINAEADEARVKSDAQLADLEAQAKRTKDAQESFRQTAQGLAGFAERQLANTVWQGRNRLGCERLKVALRDDGDLVVSGTVRDLPTATERLAAFGTDKLGIRLDTNGLNEIPPRGCSIAIPPCCSVAELRAISMKALNELLRGPMSPKLPAVGDCTAIGQAIDSGGQQVKVIDRFWVQQGGRLWLCARSKGRWEASWGETSSVPAYVVEPN